MFGKVEQERTIVKDFSSSQIFRLKTPLLLLEELNEETSKYNLDLVEMKGFAVTGSNVLELIQWKLPQRNRKNCVFTM